MTTLITGTVAGEISVSSDEATTSVPGVVSKDTRQLIETICFSGVTTLLCLVGIPGNAINCTVFSRQGLRDRMNLCLFSLALVDLCYLLCSFVMYSLPSFVKLSNELFGDEFHLKTVIALVGVSNGFRSTSSFVNMLIAVERCVCVVIPFRASTLIKTRTIGMLIVIALLFFQSWYLPYSFMHVPTLVQTEKGPHWTLVPTQLYYDTELIAGTFGNIVLGTAVPITNFVIVSTSTVITTIKLREAMTWRQNTSSTNSGGQDRQVALTKMLVIVSCIYIITMIPFVANEASFWIVKGCLKADRCYNLVMTTNAVVETCLQINGSVHIFVYYFRSSRYRKVFQSVLCDTRD